MQIHENYSLKSNNTFGIDAKAKYFVEYETSEELQQLIQDGFLKDKPFMSIGGGSNLLFVNDYSGAILHSRITTMDFVKETETKVYVKVGAGVVFDDFVEYSVKNGWYGAENLSLIPGEVGALPVQNIGAYGVEAKDIVSTVEVVNIETGAMEIMTNAECEFGYRESVFKGKYAGKKIVTHVIFELDKYAEFKLDYGTITEELKKYATIDLKTVRAAIIAIRESKLPDPKQCGNAGSFFKNPVVPKAKYDELVKVYPKMPHYIVSDEEMKIPAGWMIDQAGWKGKAHGNAAVHDKQALVLVNKGGATGAEIVELSNLIQVSILEKFGVEIFPEVIFI